MEKKNLTQEGEGSVEESYLNNTWLELQKKKDEYGTDMNNWLPLLKEPSDMIAFDERDIQRFISDEREITHITYTFNKGRDTLEECMNSLGFGYGIRIIKIWTNAARPINLGECMQVNSLYVDGVDVYWSIGTADDLQDDEVRVLAISLKKKGEEASKEFPF